MKIKMQAKMDYLLIDLIGASINYYIINNLLTVKFNHEKICSDKCYNWALLMYNHYYIIKCFPN